MPWVATVANNLLDVTHPSGAASAPTITGPLKCRVMTAQGTATAAGTELTTGSGYTAGASGLGTITWGSASAQAKSNSAALTVTNMPACSLTGVELWDSAGTPIRTEFGLFTGQPIAVGAGNTLTIAIGGLVDGLT